MRGSRQRLTLVKSCCWVRAQWGRLLLESFPRLWGRVPPMHSPGCIFITLAKEGVCTSFIAAPLPIPLALRCCGVGGGRDSFRVQIRQSEMETLVTGSMLCPQLLCYKARHCQPSRYKNHSCANSSASVTWPWGFRFAITWRPLEPSQEHQVGGGTD